VRGRRKGASAKSRPLSFSLKGGALQVARLVLALVRDLRGDGLKIHASGLAYITLVTMVPLLAISFSVLKGLGLHNQAEPFITSLLSPLGEQSREISTRIVSFIDNVQVSVLGLAGLGFLILAVLDMMRRIEAAFNDIWRVRRERTLFQRVRDYLGLLFIGPLFLSLSMALTEVLRNKYFLAWKIGAAFPDGLLSPLAGAIPYGLFILTFTVLYMFMPNTQVRLVPAAIGGTLTAVLWKVMGKLFSVFVVEAGSYDAIYSVFAALMLLMVWVYLCWVIVLIGASVAYYIQNPSNLRISRRFRALTARVRERIALRVCGETGRAFYAEEVPPTSYALAARLGLPSIVLADIIEALLAADILAVAGKTFSAGYIPGCPFDEVTVGEALARFRAAEEKGGMRPGDVKSLPEAEEILDAAEEAAQRVLSKKTLKQVAG
jgi:membrane protein